MSSRAMIFAASSLLLCCSGAGTRVPPGPPLPERRAAAADALRALRDSRFEEAARLAGDVLARDRQNPFASTVAAVARYKAAMHQLTTDLFSLAAGAFRMGGINERYLRVALDGADQELARADEELTRAGLFPDFTLELCLACWEVDWNHNGRVDDRDRRIMEIELDAQGNEMPEGDPRRRPTFQFDHGDILWARAFLAFQRAALTLAQAWRWSDVNVLLQVLRGEKPGRVVIGLVEPGRVAQARKLLLDGLELGDQARRAYLAETDDDREWLPNPRQRNHPLPLPVDDALYKTWELVIGDLRRLIRGEEGLSVAELAQLGDHQWQQPPSGYLDIGRMLGKPRAITFSFDDIDRFEHSRFKDSTDPRDARPETLLRSILGDYYREGMKPSPLISRLARMKSEVKRGEESMERKLRYLLWLN